MRCFEKISYAQFYKDTGLDEDTYQSYRLPKRGTKYSAGYDIEVLTELTILPGEVKQIPTGLKVQMQENEMLMLIVRSSLGFKHNIRLVNQVGIIERDYYNNEANEGHLWLKLQNHGEKEYTVKKGDHLVQGIFTTFLTVDSEEEIETKRKGGLGSTNKECETHE